MNSALCCGEYDLGPVAEHPALLAATCLGTGVPEIYGGDGLNFAGWAKKLTGAPTISVGSVGLSGDFFGAFQGERSDAVSLEGLVERMERGEFDLVAVGRALLPDPQWVDKVREGRREELGAFDPAALSVLV